MAKQTAVQPSYKTRIITALSGIVRGKELANPDSRNNVGRVLGDAYMWDAIYKYAEGARAAAWDAVKAQKFIDFEKEGAGEREVIQSPHFIYNVKISQPVRQFNADKLAEIFARSQYKVPKATVLEWIERAKVPTKPRITNQVVERV